MSQPVETMLEQIGAEEISMDLPPNSSEHEQRNSGDENEVEVEIDQVDLKHGVQNASENVSNTNTKITKCMRKCLRMGSRICFSDMTGEDNIVGEGFEPPKATESVYSGHSRCPSADSVHSGESLFKTFTFNPEENSAEMKKCMAFWKSVLESNLKPMNFTVVESPPKPKPRKKVSEKYKCDCKETAENRMQETWKKAWKEIQRKRLDEIKLTKTRKEQRKACDIDELGEIDRADETATIKALNQWKPKSKGPILQKSDIVKRKAKELAHKETEKIRSRSTQNIRQSGRKSSIAVKSVIGKSTTAISDNSQVMKEGSKKVLTSVEERIYTDSIIGAAFLEPRSQSKPEQTSRAGDDPDGCACGCCSEDCICEELGDDIDLLYVSSKTRTNCSCECGLAECICQEIEALGSPNGVDNAEGENSNIQSNSLLCNCGCGVIGCICQIDKSGPTATPSDADVTGTPPDVAATPTATATNIPPPFKPEVEENIRCRCGCNISGCICQRVDSNSKRRSEPDKKCPCGCGLLGCGCIDLLEPDVPGDACLCRTAACTCAGDELSPQSCMQCETCQKSVGVQCEKSVVRLTVPEKSGFYCAICGHFDCCCRNP